MASQSFKKFLIVPFWEFRAMTGLPDSWDNPKLTYLVVGCSSTNTAGGGCAT